MSILPIRQMGTVGIIKDIDPFDLPPNAFDAGLNVRFANGVMTRGPVFRSITSLSKDPAFVDGLTPLTGLDYIVLGYQDGTITKTAGPTTIDITASGWTPSSTPVQWTSTNLSDVYYVNREDRVPWYMVRNGTQMAAIPGWTSTWRCKSLRAFNSQLIAIGMTEASAEYPTTLRWSDFTTVGAPPATWNPATTNSAGRNTIAEMVNPLIDGYALRNAFALYSRDEIWLMEVTGDSNVYSFRRIFTGTGIINKNCVVERQGQHYVFGFDDIYIHDGVSKQSIAEGKVRQYIYRTMNKKYKDKFFVAHNRALNEIMFCYVSGDEAVAYPAPNGEACNRAAVYNYVSGTWTFYDLPWSTAAGISNLDTSLIWNAATASWDLTGGSWLDKDDGYKRNLMFVGLTSATYGITRQLHVLEDYLTGTTTYPVDTAATGPCYVRRTGIDLDEIQAELRGFKNIISIYPEGRVYASGAPLSFQFGASLYPDESPVLGDPMTYDGIQNYKLDYRDAGRFLTLQINYNDYRSFSLSGIDVDVVITGSR